MKNYGWNSNKLNHFKANEHWLQILWDGIKRKFLLAA